MIRHRASRFEIRVPVPKPFFSRVVESMEILALIAIVLAVAVFVKTSDHKKRLDETQRTLQVLSNRIGALDIELRALRNEPGPVADEFVPPEPVQTETVAVRTPPPRPPIRDEAPAPAPVAAKAPPVAVKGFEEALTSRWLVWLGALAIALAGTFLVRYAIDHNLLGPTARCTLGFLLGVVLTVGGEWLRERPLERAIATIRSNQVPPALTAAGLFTAFASVYAAYALYNLLPPLVAFAGLALVALLAVGLSLLQGRLVALMGLLGAFAAPAMVEAKDPSVWTLFAYLLVVEAACIAVARYKNWWWFALATLAGACVWPFLWMLDSHWSAFDMLPLGLYLLLSVCGYIALEWNAPEPEGEQEWLKEFQNLTPPDWVVWGASAAIAVVLFIVVASADYSTTGLVFAGLIAALYLFVGRRHAIFDSLPVIAAALVLGIAATMPVPTSIVQLPTFHRAPLVPVELQFFVGACIAFAALFAIAGFVALWGAKRPAVWAAVSASVPLLLLVIAYYRIVDFGVDHAWAAIAVGLAAVNLFAAERVERYREARGLDVTLAFYAAAIVASISLAAAMSVREAWLTVALSIQLPALAWINTRIRTTSLQVIAAIVACVVLTRLVFNYDILGYPLGASPPANWVIYGYGIPAISFLWAAKLFRDLKAERVVAFLEAGGLAFCVLLVSLEIRLFVAGSLSATHYGLLEQSLQSIAWLSVGSALAVHYRRAQRRVSFYGSMTLLGLAAAQIAILQVLLCNPFFSEDPVGAWPVLNVLFLAYAIPALFAFGFAFALAKSSYTRFAPHAEIAGFFLVFLYLSDEVTRAFQGPVFSFFRHSHAELYTYSVVWLVYAVALLTLGTVLRKSMLRFASLGVLVVTALKVFLIDMSALTDLYRVASFLGLGLSLVGIGYIYQRFVFPRPGENAPTATQG
jgi:uncharacterized membrane protein